MTAHKPILLDAVLFDLDGTLVDTAPDFIKTIQVLCQHYAVAPPQQQAFSQCISSGARAMVDHAFSKALATQQLNVNFERLVTEFLDLYARHLGAASKLYSSLDGLIAHLQTHNVPWGIVTNKPQRFAQPLIEKLALKPGCLFCPEQVSAAKPDPASLLAACKALKVSPQQCVYIGDHKRDIDAGRAAKMHTIAAAYGYIDANDSATHWRADFYAASPAHIEQILERHFALS